MPSTSLAQLMNEAFHPTSEPAPPRGAELVTSDGIALPLASASLRARAEGGIARVVLEQTFENVRSETVHVTYKMPLPPDGAVSGYEFTIGERTIRGEVEPKGRARERFEEAILEGRTAALLEQQRADVFTQEIGNLPAGATIVARITVDQPLAWLPEGEWELRFPTVIGPRYLGSVETAADAAAVHVHVARPADLRARLRLEIEIADVIPPGAGPASPSHALVASGGSVYELRGEEGGRLDRDVVVRWPGTRGEVGIALAAARPPAIAPHAGQAYGLLTITPPPAASVRAIPRDLIVLLDTSGSMSGAPLSLAKRVVSLVVDSLQEQDRIELVEFSSAPRAWKKQPQAATPATKREARAWIDRLEAGGGTEMYSAVVEALSSLRAGAQRQVVLVTDGYIGGEQQLVELLHERLPKDCRLHVIGVGNAMNRSLAISLSRAGRGAEVLVGLADDPERAARRLVDRTAAPVLTNLRVEGSAVVEVAPQHLPDVFARTPLVAAVKLLAEGGEVTVRGDLPGGEVWARTLRVAAVGAGEGNQAIVALFGREHVADLEMRWTIGREVEQIDRTIERVGVVFQIATRQTSWVAIDDRPTVERGSGARRITQPQELPDGTSIASFGLGGFETRAGAAMPPMQMFAAAPGGAARMASAMPASLGSILAERPESSSARSFPVAAPKRGRRGSRLRPFLVVLFLLSILALVIWAIFFRR